MYLQLCLQCLLLFLKLSNSFGVLCSTRGIPHSCRRDDYTADSWSNINIMISCWMTWRSLPCIMVTPWFSSTFAINMVTGVAMTVLFLESVTFLVFSRGVRSVTATRFWPPVMAWTRVTWFAIILVTITPITSSIPLFVTMIMTSVVRASRLPASPITAASLIFTAWSITSPAWRMIPAVIWLTCVIISMLAPAVPVSASRSPSWRRVISSSRSITVTTITRWCVIGVVAVWPISSPCLLSRSSRPQTMRRRWRWRWWCLTRAVPVSAMLHLCSCLVAVLCMITGIYSFSSRMLLDCPSCWLLWGLRELGLATTVQLDHQRRPIGPIHSCDLDLRTRIALWPAIKQNGVIRWRWWWYKRWCLPASQRGEVFKYCLLEVLARRAGYC